VKECIGIRTVYHATTAEAAGVIFYEGRMDCGTSGMFGAGIYFADTMEQARRKSRLGDDAVIIKADVDFGIALVLDGPSPAMTLETLHSMACHSVKGRSSPAADWEYAVYESSRPTNFTVIAPELTRPPSLPVVMPVEPSEDSGDPLMGALALGALAVYAVVRAFSGSNKRD
jgi:hypothetical protein